MKKHERRYFFGEPGQRLLVQEWGPLEAPTILLIHGFPGCAEQGKLISETPLWNSFRLIALDRPGYGDSDPQKKITPLKFATQISSLLDHLKINQFFIISVSGGAPYSVAVAYLMKERVLRLTSIGGVAPLSRKNFKYMNSQQKKAWFLDNFLPDAIVHSAAKRIWSKSINDIEKLFFTASDSFSPKDHSVLLDPKLGPELANTVRIAIQNGPYGILTDIRVLK